MRRVGLPLVAATASALFLLTGCWVPSLQPLESDCRKTLYDTSLFGVWTMNNCTGEGQAKECKLLIRGAESCLPEHHYDLLLTDEAGHTTRYVANLVQLGRYRFLDTEAADVESHIPAISYQMHVLPAHIFWKVMVDRQTLTLTRLDPEWLQTNLNRKKVWIAHVKIDDTLVLTAPTAQLQRFFALHASDPIAFPESMKLVWQRVAGGSGIP